MIAAAACCVFTGYGTVRVPLCRLGSTIMRPWQRPGNGSRLGAHAPICSTSNRRCAACAAFAAFSRGGFWGIHSLDHDDPIIAMPCGAAVYHWQAVSSHGVSALALSGSGNGHATGTGTSSGGRDWGCHHWWWSTGTSVQWALLFAMVATTVLYTRVCGSDSASEAVTVTL